MQQYALTERIFQNGSSKNAISTSTKPNNSKRGYDKVDGLLDEDWETDEEKEKKKQRKLKKLEDAKFHMVDDKEEEVDDVNCKEVIDPIIEEMNRRQEERKRKKSKSRSTEEPLEAPPTTVTLATKSAHKSVNFKEDTYHVFVENFHKKSVSTNSGPISDQNFFQIPTKKPMQPPAKEKKKKNTGCCGIL
ncbi:hypothetical protein B9Z55_016083 [Caenorhabditis nigoni]|nr:hypothetical protein B9Z55_016083 [Caenorhabditis nigoni]